MNESVFLLEKDYEIIRLQCFIFLTGSSMSPQIPEDFMLSQDMHMVGNSCFYENLVEDSVYILLTSTSHAK